MASKFQYKIAAGWDNVGSLVNFESVSVSSGEDLHDVIRTIADNTYLLPSTLIPFAPSYVLAAAGTYTQRGYARLSLIFPLIGVTSYAHLESTYGAGNATHRGRVTIAVRSEAFETYDNYNAIFKLADAPRPIFRGGKHWYQDLEATVLIRGEA